MYFFLKKNSFYRYKIALSIIISFILIFLDTKLNFFIKIHNYTDNVFFSIYSLNSKMYNLFNNFIKLINFRSKLISENNFLRKKLLINNSEQLLLNFYKNENTLLHKLLKYSSNKNIKKIITQVIFINIKNNISQIIIDKGLIHGINVGQIVINDQGIIGQIISVTNYNSKVLLICDYNHGLPVQILRNNIHMIAFGNGYNNDLIIKFIPNNLDIKIGDMLITSGIGGRFPKGYPVAKISSIDINHDSYIIYAKPVACLNNLGLLLVLKEE